MVDYLGVDDFNDKGPTLIKEQLLSKHNTLQGTTCPTAGAPAEYHLQKMLPIIDNFFSFELLKISQTKGLHCPLPPSQNSAPIGEGYITRR